MAKPKNVLIVDDNFMNRKLLRAILEADGLDVAEAADGLEALEAMEQQSVDVIISDLMMPNMDGYLLCLEVRKSSRLRSIPFIIYTSTFSSPRDERLAMDMGADRYITRPAPAAAILLAIHELETRAGSAPVPRVDESQEIGLMQEYSQQLVAKLEERNIELTELTSELQATDARLRHLLAHIPAVIYELELEKEGIVPYVVSENINEVLGFTPAETLRCEWWVGQLHPEDRERAIASISETISQGNSRTEYRLRHKDGSYCWVEDSRRLTRDSNGMAKELVGVWANITERKQLEEELASREQQLNGFFSNATAGLALFDRNLRYVQINDTLAKMNGVAAVEHLGKTPRQILPEIGSTLEVVLRGVLTTGEPVLNAEVAGETPRKPGVRCYWMVSYFPIGVTDGRMTGVGVIVVETTERKRAEEALRESEAKFRQLAEQIQDVFWITNKDMSEIIYASPAYEKIWGRSVEDLYHNPKEWIDAILLQDRQHVIDTYDKLAKGVAAVSVEYRLRRPDGSVRWILDRGYPVYNEGGQLYRRAGIAKDVTDSKQVEAQLLQTQKMEAIGQLAGGIAHDFNNFLGCIIGYGELALMDAAGNTAAQENLQEVLRASHRAKELVQQILMFSRRQEQERKLIKLQPVIKETLKLIRASLPVAIEIRADILAETPTVLADATQIQQIIMNLATNAVHAMKGRGQLRVELKTVGVNEEVALTKPDLRVGRYVVLSVSDTGCGMDRATRERAFEPFFTTKAPGEGTGLGLPVVHGIMKSHDGAIHVDSEPGKGSAFHLYFPVYQDSVPEAEPQKGSIPRGHGENILFVDDEPLLAVLGQKLLERAGYNVIVKTSGLEALGAFRAEAARYDMVISDLTMPNISGTELAAELLKIRPDIPIILATGFAGSMNLARVQMLGVRELLMKPLSALSLTEAVRRALPVKAGD